MAKKKRKAAAPTKTKPFVVVGKAIVEVKIEAKSAREAAAEYKRRFTKKPRLHGGNVTVQLTADSPIVLDGVTGERTPFTASKVKKRTKQQLWNALPMEKRVV